MGIIAMKCPSCGANIELDENQEYGFCKYCRTKLINESQTVQKISLEQPVQIVGKVELVNNDLEAQIAQTELAIELFLNKEHNTYDEYKNISRLIDMLEMKGANDYRYYLLLCKFAIDVNFKAYKQKTVVNLPVDSILSVYDTGMNNAIKYCKDEKKKAQIKKQYENEKTTVLEEINLYKEKKKKKRIILSGVVLTIILLVYIISRL